jgi:hypothetical protein
MLRSNFGLYSPEGAFCGFPQSFRTNCGMVPPSVSDRFLLNTFQFIIIDSIQVSQEEISIFWEVSSCSSLTASFLNQSYQLTKTVKQGCFLSFVLPERSSYEPCSQSSYTCFLPLVWNKNFTPISKIAVNCTLWSLIISSRAGTRSILNSKNLLSWKQFRFTSNMTENFNFTKCSNDLLWRNSNIYFLFPAFTSRLNSSGASVFSFMIVTFYQSTDNNTKFPFFFQNIWLRWLFRMEYLK